MIISVHHHGPLLPGVSTSCLFPSPPRSLAIVNCYHASPRTVFEQSSLIWDTSEGRRLLLDLG
jgi:hypothetical protein